MPHFFDPAFVPHDPWTLPETFEEEPNIPSKTLDPKWQGGLFNADGTRAEPPKPEVIPPREQWPTFIETPDRLYISQFQPDFDTTPEKRENRLYQFAKFWAAEDSKLVGKEKKLRTSLTDDERRERNAKRMRDARDTERRPNQQASDLWDAYQREVEILKQMTAQQSARVELAHAEWRRVAAMAKLEQANTLF